MLSLGSLVFVLIPLGGALGATADPSGPLSLQQAVGGEWRDAAERSRDADRHPEEVLTFLGLEPGMTVVEISPGSGWYTRILAPYVNRSGGAFFAAGFDPNDESAYAQRGLTNFKTQFLDQPDIYGPIEVTVVGPTSEGVSPEASADLILTFRSAHNWVPSGYAEKVFADLYRALKPGGVLGVVDHRLPEDVEAENGVRGGYIQESVVVALAETAGFVLEASSPVNANAADTADHPFGVWTLPPTGLTAGFGKSRDPNFDRTRYDAIGESDRFTLRFRKPARE
jgi:predicted methyltransferase